MASDDAIRRALDYIEIQTVISLYSQGQDSHQRGDDNILEQWDQVFAEDGVIDYSVAGAGVLPYREMAVWMRGRDGEPGRMSNYFGWQHMLSIPVIRISGDSATARTDFIAMHQIREGLPQQGRFDALGAFHDSLVRTDAGWRIRHRRLEPYFGSLLSSELVDLSKKRGEG